MHGKENEIDNSTIYQKLSECKEIIAIEKTPVTESRGVWTVVSMKGNINKAKEFIDPSHDLYLKRLNKSLAV